MVSSSSKKPSAHVSTEAAPLPFERAAIKISVASSAFVFMLRFLVQAVCGNSSLSRGNVFYSQVTRKDLRPQDWMQIWPELAGQEQRYDA